MPYPRQSCGGSTKRGCPPIWLPRKGLDPRRAYGDGCGNDRAADQGWSAGRAGEHRGSARRRRSLRRSCCLQRLQRQDPRAAASNGLSGVARPHGQRVACARAADQRAAGLSEPDKGLTMSTSTNNTVVERIKRDIADHPVVLYMKGTPVFPQCGFSAAVVQILTHMGVKFKGIDVLSDPEIRQGIKDFSSWPTIPQLYVKGEFVGGCDIVREMFEAGELGSFLKDKGIETRAA